MNAGAPTALAGLLFPLYRAVFFTGIEAHPLCARGSRTGGGADGLAGVFGRTFRAGRLHPFFNRCPKPMVSTFRSRLRERSRKVVNSIAFYPAAIGIAFLLLSFVSIRFDFSAAGKSIKSSLHWLSLRDASTARSIISSVVSGIISLTVFSFSMVMIVLNQAASQMTNRVLDKLIGNRFQQVVLGIYIGTIVYALALLSTIRDVDSGIYIPALSTYLLIVLTVFDIFLFIYFLHYITQSVKYEVIIQRIYTATKTSLLQTCSLQTDPPEAPATELPYPISAPVSGIYEGCDQALLLQLCAAHDVELTLSRMQGDFVLKGLPVARASHPVPEDVQRDIAAALRIHEKESIEGNFFYGFKQLMEVALKALSPGINDPDTAVISLRALFRLYAYRAQYYPEAVVRDEQGIPRLALRKLTFETIFKDTVLPIWDCGKDDRIIRQELLQLLTQLQEAAPTAVAAALLERVTAAVVAAGL